MRLFSDSDMGLMARLSDDNLPYSCAIESVLYVADARGARVPTYTILSTVSCRMQPVRSISENSSADATMTIGQWHVDFPKGTDVRPTYRLTISGILGVTPFTQTLYVLGTLGPRAFEMFRRVLCTERETP